MIIYETDYKRDISTNRFGGKGDVIIDHLIDEKLINDGIVMYARVTLKPGCGLGYHEHNGNTETITVISGTAQYNDNGTLITLPAGTTVHCPSGEGHFIANADDAKEDLILQALIVKK